MPDTPPTARKTLPAAREGFLVLLALLALVPVGKAVIYDTLDPDFFIHLYIADQLLHDGVGPIVDTHSYMTAKEPWTPYSWLAEFGMKALWDVFGFRGVIAAQAFMGAATVILIAAACLFRLNGSENRFTNTLVVTAFATYLTITYLSFRPGMMALCLLAVCVVLLVRDRARDERTRSVWLLPPVAVLLANIHLYVVFLPAWVAALFGGALWEFWRSAGEGRREMRRRAVRYGALFVTCAAGSLATPMLPGMLRSIAVYQLDDAMVAANIIREFMPFYDAIPYGRPAAAVVAAGVAMVAIRRRAVRPGEILWLLGSVVALLRLGRFAPVFAMAAAPICAAALPRLPDRLLAWPAVRLTSAACLVIALYYVVTALPGPAVTPDTWMNRRGHLAFGYPSEAAAFVEQHVPRRTGRIINEYNWGGYLGWRLWPRFQVLLDGRAHLFSRELWRATYLGKPEETAAFFSTLDVDAALLPQESARFQPSLETLGWRTVYADTRAVVLVPPGSPVQPQTRTTHDPE